MTGTWVVNSDGGARGNPGPAGIGVVVRAPDGSVAASGGAYIGETTNNIAEYRALLWGLAIAADLGASDVLVRADSELVVKQLNGAYRVKNEGLKPLFVQAQESRRRFGRVVFEHVRREDNAEADALANEAMDGRCEVGDAPVPPSGGPATLF